MNLTFSQGGYIRNAGGDIVGYIVQDQPRFWTVRNVEGIVVHQGSKTLADACSVARVALGGRLPAPAPIATEEIGLLYEQAKQADERFQAGLVAAYGRAGDMRYAYQHPAHPELEALGAEFRRASGAWHAAMTEFRKARKVL